MEQPAGFTPASLLLRPPQVQTLVRPASTRFDGARSTKRFNWTARFTFPQMEHTSTPRDRFGLLFVHLQQCDPGLQLLPFLVDSTANSITSAKNIPYNEQLSDYLKLPENQHAASRYLAIYVRFSSMKSAKNIKSKALEYLKSN